MTDNEIINDKGYVVSEAFAKEIEEKYIHYRKNSEIHLPDGVYIDEEWQNVAVVTKYILDRIRESPTVDTDLINRQRAEIERLTEERQSISSDIEKALDGMKEVHILYEKDISRAKAEAIKEFAERLKATPLRFGIEHVKYFDKPSIYKLVPFIDDNDIDNLVKEMTEGSDPK